MKVHVLLTPFLEEIIPREIPHLCRRKSISVISVHGITPSTFFRYSFLNQVQVNNAKDLQAKRISSFPPGQIGVIDEGESNQYLVYTTLEKLVRKLTIFKRYSKILENIYYVRLADIPKFDRKKQS